MNSNTMDSYKCCLCDKTFNDYGNNPYPLCKEDDTEALCCDGCNATLVLPVRLNHLSQQKEEKSVAVCVSDEKVQLIPLQSGEGATLKMDDMMDEFVVISGHDAFHPDVMVKTTNAAIRGLFESTNKEEAKSVFPQVWNSIKNVDSDALFKRGGKAWDNFMNDILIYYVCRLHLFNHPIPVVIHKAIVEAAKDLGKKGRKVSKRK